MIASPNPNPRPYLLDRAIDRQRRVFHHRLHNQPHRTLPQVKRLLPRCWHDPTFPWNQTPPATRGRFQFPVDRKPRFRC